MNDAVRAIVGLILVTGATNSSHAVELIRNGSFEADEFTSDRLFTSWGDGSGRGFNILEYPFGDCGSEWCSGTAAFEVPGPPSSGVSGPAGRGQFYAYAFSTGDLDNGSIVYRGHAEQHVALASHEGRMFDFSAWLASRAASGDRTFAIVSMEFFEEPNATGASLGMVSLSGNDFGGPTDGGSANSSGVADPAIPSTQDNWTFHTASGFIPVGTQSAAITIRGDTGNPMNSPFVSYGFVDLVSLQVVPEPSSIVIALVGVLVCYVVATRRRRQVSSLTGGTGC